MNRALKKDTGKELFVYSGYRSPAYQIIVFLMYLNSYNYNVNKTCKRAALPGYSEHSSAKSPAVDFITLDGKPSDKDPLDFAKTKEYKWLVENAAKFYFYETYQKNNDLGVMHEPWHWRYLK